MKKSQRKFIVFLGLVGLLTVTSALLLALAPAPLVPDAVNTLYAVDESELDVIFQTKAPLNAGRWKHIYIHHTRTPSGNATTLAQANNGLGDHFVIGNGDGCVDGEIQIGHRWSQQFSAEPPLGVSTIDPNFISICLVGNFDVTVPTPMQLRRLDDLVSALQARLKVPSDAVVLVQKSRSSAGIGRYFPSTAFRERLVR